MKTAIALLGLFTVSTAGFAAPAKKPAAKPGARPAAPGAKSPALGAAPAVASSSYQAPYGMAGCGLGAIIFGSDNGKFMQIMAGTTNQASYQTFAITSGTSKCVADPTVAAAEREVFVIANFNTLSKEAAQGQGESLEAFADVLGCRGDDAYPLFKKLSQDRYNAIFTSIAPADVANNFVKEVKGSKELANRCERLG